MGYNDMQTLSDVPSYSMSAIGKGGAMGSIGGIAMRDSLVRGSSSGLMDLLNSMDARGMSNALRETGFAVEATAIKLGRSAVFGSVREDISDALKHQVDGFDLQAMREKAAVVETHTQRPFAAKAAESAEHVEFPGSGFQGDTAAAKVVQTVLGSHRISIELLGKANAGKRSALTLVAGQALQKGIIGFGFDGTEGKYQVALSMDDMVDLHRVAAQAVAVESARSSLTSWAAGGKVAGLSAWVPDSVQRLLHGSVSLKAAETVVAAIEGGAISRHAGEIGEHEITGLLAAKGFDVNAPTVREIASDRDLTVNEPNRVRGQYHGTVVALDHRAALVKYARTSALELPFTALPPGQSRPTIGDSLRVGFKAGEMTITMADRLGRERPSR